MRLRSRGAARELLAICAITTFMIKYQRKLARRYSITSSARSSMRGRDSEAERLGGLQVDDQLVFGRLLNREVGRTGALEDAVDIGCGLRVQGEWVDPIGHQTASPGNGRAADQGQTVPDGGGRDRIFTCSVKSTAAKRSDRRSARVPGRRWLLRSRHRRAPEPASPSSPRMGRRPRSRGCTSPRRGCQG